MSNNPGPETDLTEKALENYFEQLRQFTAWPPITCCVCGARQWKASRR